MTRRGALELWRLVPFAAIAAAAMLVLGGMYAALYSEHLYETQKLRDLGVQARILAEAVRAPLEFDDPETADEYVQALRASTDIEAAGVYDGNGMMAAGFARDGATALPPSVDVRAPYLTDNRIVVVVPVETSGAQIGAVYVRALSAPLAGRLLRWGVIGLFAVMAALVLGVLGVAHAALRSADLQLRQRADALEESNRERLRVEEALRQAQKMDALGQLTGGVAHDFNNLLAVVTSGLRLLSSADSAERRAQIMTAIHQAVDRGARLTRQLLAFARRQPLNAEIVDPGALILGMRELLQRSLREDIRVEIKMPPGLWRIKADPSQLELAVLNLAVNARDAMAKGGLIVIAGENVPGEGGDADAVRLSVKDNGQGMPQDVASRAFEPFFTTKDLGKGTGLGLSLVYGVATQSGGSATIESKPGAGATVILTFPRAAAEGEAETENRTVGAEPAVEIPSTPRKILVVEDDDMVAAMVCPLIEELGYSCVRVSSAAEALERLAGGEQFDIVFSDIMMPGGMNGLELARLLRQKNPDLPVVLTTGYSSAIESAGSEFPVVRKPYQSDELARALAGSYRTRRA